MSRSSRLRPLGAAALLAFGAALPAAAQTRSATAAPPSVEIELDRFRLAVNEIQRPNDASADRFSALPYVGSGLVTGRLSVDLPFERWGAGHRIGLAWAPLTAEGSAPPATALRYQGSTFAAGVPMDLRYRFDTWRFTYSVPLLEPDAGGAGWSLRAGGTLAIRDAQIRLSQAGRTEDFTNVGPVPLLHVSARRELGSGWAFEGAFDAFPAPGGGGLFDGTARIGLRLTPSLTVAAGIRHLEGGASGSALYTYLRATSATLTLRASF
ncbi:MAG: hypothetical protein RJA99_1940 [Pseudomonadota bacterium]|jgi:hypothetical protein